MSVTPEAGTMAELDRLIKRLSARARAGWKRARESSADQIKSYTAAAEGYAYAEAAQMVAKVADKIAAKRSRKRKARQ